MANQQGNFLNVIDVGSAKTCALVAEITENGLRYRGHGIAESRGSRKGVIVDLEKAVCSIQKAVEGAEDKAGAPAASQPLFKVADRDFSAFFQRDEKNRFMGPAGP